MVFWRVLGAFIGGDTGGGEVRVDIVMPRLDGRALKAALHGDPRWADVPVVLITGEVVSRFDNGDRPDRSM